MTTNSFETEKFSSVVKNWHCHIQYEHKLKICWMSKNCHPLKYWKFGSLFENVTNLHSKPDFAYDYALDEDIFFGIRPYII